MCTLAKLVRRLWEKRKQEPAAVESSASVLQGTSRRRKWVRFGAVFSGLLLAGTVGHWWYLWEWHKRFNPGNRAMERGDYVAALDAYTQAHQWISFVPWYSFEDAHSLYGIGVVQMELRQFKEAEDAMRRASAMYRDAGPSRLDQYAKALTSLGFLYESQGRDADAEALYLQAVVTYQTSALPEEHVIMRGLRALRWVLLEIGFDPYEPTVRGIEQGRQEHEDLRRFLIQGNLATTLNNLASLAKARGQLQKEETYLKQALEVYIQLFAPYHPELVAALPALLRGEKKDGQRLSVEAVTAATRTLFAPSYGDKRMGLARALNNLGEAYREQGRYMEAAPLYAVGIGILEGTYQEQTPLYPFLLTNLGLMYNLQDRYAEAEPYLHKAWKIRQTMFPPTHPDIAQSLINLGLWYLRQKRYAEAEPYYRDALAIREQVLGLQHEKTVFTLEMMVRMYLEQRRLTEAESLYRKLVQSREATLGTGHSEVLSMLAVLADLCIDQGRDEPALAVVTERLRRLEGQVGKDNAVVVPDLTKQAKLLRRLGRIEDAKAVELRIQTLKGGGVTTDRHKTKI
jgi:tetratricopeptide (TPR) repeat protein